MGAKEFLIEAVTEITDALNEAKAYREGRPSIQEELLADVDTLRGKFEKFAIDAAFESIGLEVESSGGINPQSITQAINAKFLADVGLELTDIFSADALKTDLEKFALSKISAGLDIEITSLDPERLKDVLSGYVRRRMEAQIKDGAGSMIDGAPDKVALLALIEKANELRGKPLSDAPGAQSNRDRQAKYRAAHKRHWEKR